MIKAFYLIVFAMFVTMLVLSEYFKRNDVDKNGNPESKPEPSMKEQMLMGISVPKPEEPEEPHEESFLEHVYSGKGPQPKYMRYMADHERRRAVETAREADEKEREEEQKPGESN